MNTSSFNKITSIATLLIFLATPSLASAQGLLGGSGSGASDPTSGLLTGLLVGKMMSGGSLSGSSAGGAGGAGQAGQFLALAGLLSGNMGLAMAGMLMSMLGGLASSAGGGAGSTPQTGTVDEQYVAPGQAGPSGVAANSPYYTAPSTSPTPSTSPAAPACSQSLFIVKDTTVNPATTKPYPATESIAQSDCLLVINADAASHSLGGNSVAAQASQIFKFQTKKVYKMCIDNSTTACTSITVQ